MQAAVKETGTSIRTDVEAPGVQAGTIITAVASELVMGLRQGRRQRSATPS